MSTEINTHDELTIYKIKYRTLFFGAFSIIFLAIAFGLMSYEFSFSSFTTVITKNGSIVKDSTILFLFFLILSVLFSFIGSIYSLINKKIIGFLFNIIIFSFFASLVYFNQSILKDTFSSIKIENRANVSLIKSKENNLSIDINTSSSKATTPPSSEATPPPSSEPTTPSI